MAYRFKASGSMSRVLSYMKKCMEDGMVLDADEIPESALDAAVVKLSKESDVPIIVTSQVDAHLLSISQSHRRVFMFDDLPKKFPYAIYYINIDDAQSLADPKPLLVVRKR